MEKEMKNAISFKEVLVHCGINAYLVDSDFPEAQQVIVRWERLEGAQFACHRLSKVGIYAEAVPLACDTETERLSGIHFTLVDITRLGIGDDDLRTLAVITANVLLGEGDLEEAKEVVGRISARLSPSPYQDMEV
jgi:glycine/serine hydroxymethyltransferase